MNGNSERVASTCERADFPFYKGLDNAGKSEKNKVSTIQKREYFRVDVPEQETFTVILEINGSKLTGCRLVNISIGGVAVLALRHPIVLEIGSRIKETVIMFPGGEEIRSPAVVRYILGESDSEWNKYGVQFTGLSDAQSKIIAKYVFQTEAKKIKEQRTMPAKEEKVGAPQRRKHYRIDVPELSLFNVTLKADVSKLMECRLMNISMEGAVVAVRQPIVFDMGSKIKKIKITFPGGEEIRCQAVVKHVSKESEWNKYGVQFTSLSKEQGSIIAKYMILSGARKLKEERTTRRANVPEIESSDVALEFDVDSLTKCKLMNISVGGAAILAVRYPFVLKLDASIKELTITFPGGEEVTSPAVVKYVLRESDSVWNKYGVQFTGLSDAQSSIIAKYVLQTEAKEIKE